MRLLLVTVKLLLRVRLDQPFTLLCGRPVSPGFWLHKAELILSVNVLIFVSFRGSLTNYVNKMQVYSEFKFQDFLKGSFIDFGRISFPSVRTTDMSMCFAKMMDGSGAILHAIIYYPTMVELSFDG